MLDRRELILAQLFAILNSVKTANPNDIKTVVRNRALLKTEKRLGIVLLDGDETSRLNRDRMSGRGEGFTPSILQMRPQVFILAQEQRPTNEDLGPDVNGVRNKIVQAVASDAMLKTLYTANGSIVYNGTVTDMKSGGAVTGLMMLDFSIMYPLIPD